MKTGFSFCGVNIADIGLEYAPELEDTYVYKDAKTRIHEETFDGHDGGYFYGTSKEPKEFVLKCIFEEKEIDRGLMANVMHLFQEGRSGELVFDRRPWCYYYATVTELDPTEITNYLNGIIKITMKAYYPFARSDYMYVSRKNRDYYKIMSNTAMFDRAEMVPPMSFMPPITEPVTEDDPILLANPGTEYAPVSIEIAGYVGDGVIIKNLTTGQECKFVAMSEEEFDGENNYIHLDGISGKCLSVKNGVSTMSFLYHDSGFIRLMPAFPAERNVMIHVKDGEVLTVNKLYDRNTGGTREFAKKKYVGKHIWIDKEWYEITDIGNDLPEEERYYSGTVQEAMAERTAYTSAANGAKDEHTIHVAGEPYEGTDEISCIFQMNKITITPLTTMKLTRLRFIYKPTFA